MEADDAPMTFGELLREKRGTMSQRRLARLLEDAGWETTGATISAWEIGKYTPKQPAMIRELEQLLECDGELTQALGWSEEGESRFGSIERRLEALEQLLRDVTAEIRSGQASRP